MEPSAQPSAVFSITSQETDHVSRLNVAVETAAVAVEMATATTRRIGTTLAPVAQVIVRPPLLPARLQPSRLLPSLSRRGAKRTESVLRATGELLDALVPRVVEEVLRRIDLTEIVTRYVDLDGIVANVDLDSAASRLDVDAVAERLDLDSIAARLDVDAVARRLDLDAVIGRLDLTAIVLERVDIDAIVQATLTRIDLAGLAEEVIDAVDLPELVRESTGSMASDTVRGARMQGIAADEAVGRAVDRLLLRRGRRTPASAEPAPYDQPGPSAIPSQKERSGADRR